MQKLRTLADKMQPAIDDKLADKLTNTPKRLAQANNSRLEGERLQRTQSCLYALATLHDAENCPQILLRFTSKKSIYECMATKLTPVTNACPSYNVCTGEPRYPTPEVKALWTLLNPKSPTTRKADELRRKIDGLQFTKIPGYFPTPNVVIDKMIDAADLYHAASTCEPSAGSGAIADRLTTLGYSPDCYEVNYTLRDILSAKGHRLVGDDFLSIPNNGLMYDCIIMNPPFERGQDIDHVRRAFDLLSPGGRLVSIMSPSPFFNQSRKSFDFRQWFALKNGYKEELPADSFKSSGTGAKSIMVMIIK